MTRLRRASYRIARWAFFIASLAYLVMFAQRALRESRVSMPDLLRASAEETVAAALVFSLAAVGSVVGWHALLQCLAGMHLSRRGVVQVFCMTQIAKYLPGNVGHHIGRIALARTQLGVPAMTTALSLLQEGALLVAAALIVGAVCVLAAPVALPLPAGVAAGPLLLGILVAGFGTWGLVRRQGDRLGPDAPRWLAWLSRAAPTWPSMRIALPAYVGIHVANGIAVTFVASASLPVSGMELALLTGAYSLAWMVGFLLPGAPGGLGVRESAFLMLIATAWPADVAFGIAMLARAANVAADAWIFAAGLVLAGKVRHRGHDKRPVATHGRGGHLNRIRAFFGRLAPLLDFRGSRQYWETRYRIGGHSGEGSRGKVATYKAEILNDFFRRHSVCSAVEFGCGDGYQLQMLQVPRYLGVDVSETILAHCRALFAEDDGKRFVSVDAYAGDTADVAMSIDVIFHLVEDDVYDEYLRRLFAAAERFVVVYSTSANMAGTGVKHVRHRDVEADVAQRFPQFRRMAEDEASLPPPVRFDRGLPVRFFFYSREAGTA